MSDYTTRFRTTGQAEIDRLIEIYNRMADALCAERVRVREQHHFLQSLAGLGLAGAAIYSEGRRGAIDEVTGTHGGPGMAPEPALPPDTAEGGTAEPMLALLHSVRHARMAASATSSEDARSRHGRRASCQATVIGLQATPVRADDDQRRGRRDRYEDQWDRRDDRRDLGRAIDDGNIVCR